MKLKRLALRALFAICPSVMFGPLVAADPLEIYIGGAVGKATVRADEITFVAPTGNALTGPISLSKSETGWKILGGVRPISLLGAEVEYVEFGSPTASNTPAGYGLGYTVDMRSKAAAAFGVFYVPIPVPLLDVYGKVGLARVQTTVDATAGLGCFGPLLCPVAFGDFKRHRTDSRFAYGAGVQVKPGRFAIRAEYERISTNTGDPDLLSVGATWTF